MEYSKMKSVVLEQSANDMMCDKSDFLKTGFTVVSMDDDEKSRSRGHKKSIPCKLFCNLLYFGTGLVCTVDSKIYDEVKKLLESELYSNKLYKMELFRVFEPDFIYRLNEILIPFGKKINCMANFCLPAKDFLDFSVLSVKLDNFEYKFFFDKEIAFLYNEKGFDNALDYGSCLLEDYSKRKDKIAIAAYIDNKIAGVAACTDDCDSMWQIGVDVLPEFRGKNIASFLVNKLSHKIFEKGKVPYYCSAWSNVASRNTAIKAGLKPAWVEIACVEW